MARLFKVSAICRPLDLYIKYSVLIINQQTKNLQDNGTSQNPSIKLKIDAREGKKRN